MSTTFKIYGECHGCKEKKWFVRVREFQAKVAGIITSKNRLCGECVTKIKEMLK